MAAGAPSYKSQAWLEKFGWEKGKGLGRNEQGITDFIRASKKDDNAGLGLKTTYDLKDFSHWDNLYTKAAKNVKISSGDGESVKIASKAAPPPPLKKETVYSGMFVKSTTVIDSSRVEKNGVDNDSSSSDSSDSDSSDSEDAGKGKKSVRKEDDLFAACGQRELRLFKQEGKAARLAEQEASMGSFAKYGTLKAFAQAANKPSSSSSSSSSESEDEKELLPPPTKKVKKNDETPAPAPVSSSSSSKSKKDKKDEKDRKEKEDKKKSKKEEAKQKEKRKEKKSKKSKKSKRRDSSSDSDDN